MLIMNSWRNFWRSTLNDFPSSGYSIKRSFFYFKLFLSDQKINVWKIPQSKLLQVLKDINSTSEAHVFGKLTMWKMENISERFKKQNKCHVQKNWAEMKRLSIDGIRTQDSHSNREDVTPVLPSLFLRMVSESGGCEFESWCWQRVLTRKPSFNTASHSCRLSSNIAMFQITLMYVLGCVL